MLGAEGYTFLDDAKRCSLLISREYAAGGRQGNRMIEIRFGYWPCKWELDVDDARIRPLPDYDSTVEMMRESGRVVGKWFYPPFTRAYDSKPTLDPRPEVYESVYGIKATHFLTVPDGAA